MSLPTPMASSSGGVFKRGNQKLQTIELEARLPTPLVSRSHASHPNHPRGAYVTLDGIDARSRALPTPMLGGDWNRRGSSPSSGDGLSAVGGPSIRLREWMMGLPKDWIAVDASGLARLREMASSSRALKRSAKRSSNASSGRKE